MRPMRFQFSLATLLVCMTVLAVVSAICAMVQIPKTTITKVEKTAFAEWQETSVVDSRRPNPVEIGQRLAWADPPAIAATLGVLWTVRRLKSRRHSEPPVGVK